jgi:hypothetical protein
MSDGPCCKTRQGTQGLRRQRLGEDLNRVMHNVINARAAKKYFADQR